MALSHTNTSIVIKPIMYLLRLAYFWLIESTCEGDNESTKCWWGFHEWPYSWDLPFGNPDFSSQLSKHIYFMYKILYYSVDPTWKPSSLHRMKCTGFMVYRDLQTIWITFMITSLCFIHSSVVKLMPLIE